MNIENLIKTLDAKDIITTEPINGYLLITNETKKTKTWVRDNE